MRYLLKSVLDVDVDEIVNKILRDMQYQSMYY